MTDTDRSIDSHRDDSSLQAGDIVNVFGSGPLPIGERPDGGLPDDGYPSHNPEKETDPCV